MIDKFKFIFNQLIGWIRRPIPATVISVSIVFSYNLFLKKRFVMPRLDEDIITLNLKYFSNNFELLAEKGIEKAGKKFLYGLRIDNEKGKLKSGYANIISEKDAIFQQGVEGNNQVWNFKSDEARYSEQDKDVVFTLIGNVDTYNQEKKLRIKSDNFRLSDNLKILKLKGNIAIESEKTKLFGEIGEFDENSNLFKISDSVAIEIVVNDEVIRIETVSLEYDIVNKTAKTDDKFSIRYKDLIIKGVAFAVENENFVTENNVQIISQDNKTDLYSLNAKYIDKQLTLLDLNGKYDGKNINAKQFVNKDNKTVMDGDIIIEDIDQKLSCDKLVVDENFAIATGTVIANSKEYRIETNEGKYDRNKKLVIVNSSKILFEDGEIISTYLEYANDGQAGFFKNMKYSDSDKKILADRAIFDLENENYKLEGNVQLERDGMVMRPSILESKGGVFRIPELNITGEKLKIAMTNCIYDKNVKDFSTEDLVSGEKNGYRFRTKGFKYNEESGNGTLLGDFTIENIKDKFKLYSHAGKIENKVLVLDNPKGKRDDVNFVSKLGKFNSSYIFDMEQDVVVDKEKLIAYSEKLSFDLNNNMLFFDIDTDISYNDMLLSATKGNIFLDEEKIFAENIVLVKESGDTVKADFAELYKNMEIMEAKSNIHGVLANGDTFKSEFGRIFFSKKDDDHNTTRAELNDNVTFTHKDLSIHCDFLEYDNAVGHKGLELVYARDNLKITDISEDGETDIKAEYAFYELNQEVGRIKRNVVITHKNESYGTVNASADEALHDNKNNKISLSGNVKAKGTKSALDISGDDVEFDLNTGIINSQGKAGFSYDFINKNKEDKEGLELKREVIKEFETEIDQAEKIISQFEDKPSTSNEN